MSLEIRPIEIIAMVFYVMAQHSKLVLILLEMKSSSLSCLFEDAQEIEENICSSKRIQDPVYFEDMHAQEQRSYQYVSVFEQEDSEYEADLEQQQECEYMSDWESNTLVFADVPMDMYAWQVDDQFSNHFDHEVTDDCIGNFMFLVDHNPYDVRPFLSSSYEHHSEEMIVTTDDQDLITRGLEGYQFSSEEAIMDVQLFSMDQYVFHIGFKDPVVSLMESYISNHLIISYFLSPAFTGEYGVLNFFLSWLICFSYYILINGMDKIISVLKLLEWMLWTFDFT
jgi:hypothetical protein